LVAGVVTNEIGLFWTFGLLALLVVVSSGLAMRLWPSADPELLEHEHGPLRHEHLHMTSITSIRAGRALNRTAIRP
jgi:hypothetical protein